MSNKPKSTFEKEMQNKSFHQKFDKAYDKFLRTELVLKVRGQPKKEK